MYEGQEAVKRGGGYVSARSRWMAQILRYLLEISYNMERRIAEVEVDLPKHFHVVIWS
jgi:hypothetical protein